MEFAYGVTCVPERFETTLPRTLQSLALGGFDAPRLFVDGPGEVPDSLKQYEITHHRRRVRAYANWLLALWELWLARPTAERFCIFQDDCLCLRNLRAYLAQGKYPQRGYCNLITFPENQKLTDRNRTGWFPANQRGKGAVALMFDNATVRKFLSSPFLVDRVLDKPDRNYKCIDGAVVTAMNKLGIKEHCHMPALVSHIGDVSSMGLDGGKANRTKNTGNTFPGEDADALAYGRGGSAAFAAPQPRASGRIGLVGGCGADGLGAINRAVAEYCEVHRWLLRPDSRAGIIEPPQNCEVTVCLGGAKLEEFLRGVDVVVFAEQPPYDRLVDVAAKLNVKTALIASHPWMPSACRGWAIKVDRFICPTDYAYQQFKEHKPSALFPWPCDTERFPFRQRERAERFVYVHGGGGHRGCCGGKVVQDLIARWPQMPLTIFDQTGTAWGGSIEVVRNEPDNRKIYEAGDVLLVPYHLAAVGQVCLEALASGMPVIVPEGSPWDEFPALARIRAQRTKTVFRRPVDWFQPEPSHLEQLCRERLGMNIAEQSRAARAWANARSWTAAGPALTKLLRGEITDQSGLDNARMAAVA